MRTFNVIKLKYERVVFRSKHLVAILDVTSTKR